MFERFSEFLKPNRNFLRRLSAAQRARNPERQRALLATLLAQATTFNTPAKPYQARSKYLPVNPNGVSSRAWRKP